MDVLVSGNINALNGSTVKIPCTFTSCYKMDATKFSMNWTYQESLNDTEEMVKLLVFACLTTLIHWAYISSYKCFLCLSLSLSPTLYP